MPANHKEASLIKYFGYFCLSMQDWTHTNPLCYAKLLILYQIHMATCDQKTSVLPYLEGEGEWLCRPYCLSHSSLSFSRLSRSLKAEPVGQTIATSKYQTVTNFTHTHTHTLTSSVFCVPWLAALPLVPVK